MVGDVEGINFVCEAIYSCPREALVEALVVTPGQKARLPSAELGWNQCHEKEAKVPLLPFAPLLPPFFRIQ